MQNFDAELFQKASRVMAEAQACAPGEELPDRGQDVEYAKWVCLYADDAVRCGDLHLFWFILTFLKNKTE
jgi:hypothetical protein